MHGFSDCLVGLLKNVPGSLHNGLMNCTNFMASLNYIMNPLTQTTIILKIILHAVQTSKSTMHCNILWPSRPMKARPNFKYLGPIFFLVMLENNICTLAENNMKTSLFPSTCYKRFEAHLFEKQPPLGFKFRSCFPRLLGEWIMKVWLLSWSI